MKLVEGIEVSRSAGVEGPKQLVFLFLVVAADTFPDVLFPSLTISTKTYDGSGAAQARQHLMVAL